VADKILSLPRDERGFTLVEMMISMVVILIVLLGLVQAALLSIEHNVRNQLRDEAVRVAEQRMNGVLVDTGNNRMQGLRNLPFTDAGLNQGLNCFTVQRNIGNVQRPFTVCTTIGDVLPGETKSVQVSVGWDFKGEITLANRQIPTNNEYQHTIMTIIRRTLT